ncbi:MAG: DUF6786 family protein [Flavitalea sp.]
MKLTTGSIFLAFSFSIFLSCNDSKKNPNTKKAPRKGSYAYDAEFLKQHTKKVIELVSSDSTSKILLSADYQGRVMTSTADGDSGISFGWLNYALIGSGEKKKNFNPVGGEERFWLGPEGGQYSLYFKRGDSFNISAWQVPPLIDTVMYDVVEANNSEVLFAKINPIVNYSGNAFELNIQRKIRMMDKKSVEQILKTTIPANIKFVGYETVNSLQNIGKNDWTRQTGLLSIWLLGMFTPTPQTTVIIPFHPDTNVRTYITDNYFGAVPAERLQVTDSVLFFVCDGNYRSKIGISPVIAKPVAASYDFQNNVLTVIIPETHKNVPYVNSKWEIQKEPYKGDVINSYNDGPLEDGTQMGPFYEIESSSPALELKAGHTGTYRQVTCHLQGDFATLRLLAKSLLGADLDSIKK